MPMIDMPLEELKAYGGLNPKPEDFEAYWQRALAELDEVDTDVEICNAEFQSESAQCFDLFFNGVGGARVHAKYLRNRSLSEPGRAILEFHGYTMSSGSWFTKLPYVAGGASVASLDVRGQGGLSEDNGTVMGTTHNGHIVRGLDDHPDRLFYRRIFLDTVQLARIVMSFDEVDPRRVGTVGRSQGGALALACAALEPRIRRAAVAFPFLCDYKRVWEMDLINQAYSELPEFFRKHDPQHKRIDTWWERLGYIDIQHLAPLIQADVLMGSGLMDVCCPPSTQFAAYNKIKSSKELMVYPDFGHTNLPGFDDHQIVFLNKM